MRAGFERLHSFLTAPQSLTEHPTYLLLRDRIAKARAAHQPTSGLRQALQDWLHCQLASSSGEQRTSGEGGSQ